jgi:diacylglycerol kinase family enzyme
VESAPVLAAGAGRDPARQPLVVVLNARSGKRDRSCAKRISGILEEAAREHDVFTVSHSRHLTERAEEAARSAAERGGCVVAAGGDGTINCVAQAALRHGCPMGLVPLGTFNFVARTHGIPLEPAAATRALLSATVRPIQVGMVNGRAFMVNASIGLYRRLLEDRESFKLRFGRRRIVGYVSAIATLLRPHPSMHVQIEGAEARGTIETLTLFVGNNAMQLEQVGIEEAALIGHGRLLGLTLRPMGRFAALGLVLRAALGRLGDSDHVNAFVFRRIALDFRVPMRRRRVKVAVDGEVTELVLPLTFSPAPAPLLLLTPAHPDGSGSR